MFCKWQKIYLAHTRKSIFVKEKQKQSQGKIENKVTNKMILSSGFCKWKIDCFANIKQGMFVKDNNNNLKVKERGA